MKWLLKFSGIVAVSLCLIVLLRPGTLSAEANLLTNGDAETNDLSGWTVTNGGDGWGE